ncbi:MAG: DUF2087 domain-containing protein [Chloroflexota bacterium]
MSRVTVDEFRKLFVATVLKGRGYPRKRRGQQIILLSVISLLDKDEAYTEKEMNTLLSSWVEKYGEELSMDHVALRRALIDEKLVNRDNAGTVYVLNSAHFPIEMDGAILNLDLDQLIREELADQARRKEQYQKPD